MRSPLRWATASIFAFTLLVYLGAAPMVAQQALDSTKADPAHHKVEFENEQVRVVRYHIEAGDQTVRHSHPDSVLVVLHGGSVQNTSDDGKTTTTEVKDGAAVWRPALTHVTKNVGNKPIEGFIIEPKNPHSARPAGSADETTEPNPLAKVEFENDKVRVVRYRFNPGDKNAMHGHPDNVQVVLTDTKANVTTPDGKTTPSQGKAGQVNWRPATVHSVQNTGDKPFEGVDVEMKGTPAAATK
ncbi:MAG: hypothetical protein ACR2IF_11030 [Terriglobales bacterium]